MIWLELKWLFYYPSWILHFSEFVWTLRSSAWVVFNDFLLIDATDRSKISSDQKRLFFAVSLYLFSFFVNTSFILEIKKKKRSSIDLNIHYSKFSNLISLLARDRLTIDLSEVRTVEWNIINLEHFWNFWINAIDPLMNCIAVGRNSIYLIQFWMTLRFVTSSDSSKIGFWIIHKFLFPEHFLQENIILIITSWVGI